MSDVMLMYHPVKKEVYFLTNDNGGFHIVPYSDCPRLQEYSPDQGEFLLQNQGYQFFDDILETFLGLEHYKLLFKGTKLDYEDFIKMVNHYNEYRKKKMIQIGEFIELPEVSNIYDSITKFSYETSLSLETNLSDNHTRSIFEARRKMLAEKIAELEKNSVNLCMVGTYSSGKSTFINAIIGKKILPESINSETAKMFKIVSSNEPSITFVLKKENHFNGEVERLFWNESMNRFEFENAISSHELKNSISMVLTESSEVKQHEQIHNILKTLNDFPNKATVDGAYLDGIIEVRYPISISKDINFTFFDTPGTDSNSDEHLLILKDALKKQTNSILIVLYSPVKMEGTGNSILYRLLEESKDNNEEKVTIDLTRSLHIINQADRYDEEELKDLINRKIKASLSYKDAIGIGDSNELEYDLSKKRVFYVSSKGGFCAKAILNDAQEDADVKFIRRNADNINEDQYFRLNKLAGSENETDEMIKSCNRAVELANEIENDKLKEMKKLHINSGMYAVEEEIVKYAEKYALAVKAKGLYSAVLHMIEGVKDAYLALESQANKSEKEISEKINVMRNQMSQSMHEIYDRFCMNIGLRTANLVELKEMQSFIAVIQKDAEKEADKMITLAFRKSTFAEKNQTINRNLGRYAGELDYFYKRKRVEILEKQMKQLKDEIIQIIKDYRSSGIEEELLKEILNINTTNVPGSQVRPFSMDRFIKERRSIFMLKVDKKEYRDSVVKAFLELTAKQYDAYIDEIHTVAKKQGKEMIEEILSNIEELSLSMEKLVRDKDQALRMQKDAKAVLDIVYAKNQELDERIWGGLK